MKIKLTRKQRETALRAQERMYAWLYLDALYDIAKGVNHDYGFPWTDPRTGKTYPPPKKRKRKKK